MFPVVRQPVLWASALVWQHWPTIQVVEQLFSAAFYTFIYRFHGAEGSVTARGGRVRPVRVRTRKATPVEALVCEDEKPLPFRHGKMSPPLIKRHGHRP